MYIYRRFISILHISNLLILFFILLEEKSNVDSLELRSVLAYLCLKPKVKCKLLKILMNLFPISFSTT